MIVRHHPRRHPYVDNLWPQADVSRGHLGGADGPVASVWDVDALVRDGVDVVHVHFGFEDRGDDGLSRWADRLVAAGIGLVHTVHDLDNPHLSDQGVHHRNVAVLVERAGVVATLTTAAATHIGHRWDREAVVVPHPHVVPLADMARHHRRAVRRRGIYVHAATGRPNLDVDAIDRLAAGAPHDTPVVVHVRPDAPARVLAPMTRLAVAGRIILDVRARLSDDQLWDRLASAELVVLPYRWGTHSGLLEAAHDLGTPVLAPDLGGYRDQGAQTYRTDPCERLVAARTQRPRVTVAGRRLAAQTARARYAELYARAARGQR